MSNTVTAGALLDLTEHKRHRSTVSHKYLDTNKKNIDLKTGNSHGEVVFHEAAVSEAADPQLDAHNSKYEEDKEA